MAGESHYAFIQCILLHRQKFVLQILIFLLFCCFSSFPVQAGSRPSLATPGRTHRRTATRTSTRTRTTSPWSATSPPTPRARSSATPTTTRPRRAAWRPQVPARTHTARPGTALPTIPRLHLMTYITIPSWLSLVVKGRGPTVSQRSGQRRGKVGLWTGRAGPGTGSGALAVRDAARTGAAPLRRKRRRPWATTARVGGALASLFRLQAHATPLV